MTGKELIKTILDENALYQRVSIEIDKHKIQKDCWQYEYFDIVDIIVSGKDLIIRTEVKEWDAL